MKRDLPLFLFTLAFCLRAEVSSKTITGTFSSSQAVESDGQYVTKFCFHGESAEVQYEVNSTGNEGKLYFFLDEHWASANSETSCWDKLRSARLVHELRNVTGNQTLSHFMHPKTWHIVYGDSHTCQSGGVPLHEPSMISYKLVLLNPDTLGNPTDHFSDEETGLLGFYQILVIVYFVLLCIFSSEVYHAIAKGGPMYLVLKMLSIGMVIQCTGIFCMFLHLYGYSKDGVGSPFLQFISEFLDICAHFQMLYLLINLSLGWTLGSSKIHHLQLDVWKSRPVIPVAISLSVYQGILLMWELLAGSEHKVYNAYQNTAGVLLIIIRLMLALIFTGNLYGTVSLERSALRREFYKNFAKSCLIWFLCYPIMVVTSLVFSSYLRYKLITIGVVSAQSVAMILLYKLFLSRSLYWEVSALSASTMPLRMEKNFGIKLYR